jgi:N-acetylmuramic acid 6-phosphate etherase
MDHLTTEQANLESIALDSMTPIEIVRLMNHEDAKVLAAVEAVSETIAQAIEKITQRVRDGGRLMYLGAGTSGRLGVLDAVECPTTFSTPPGQVVGIIAGGLGALTHAIEGAEDNELSAVEDLNRFELSARDCLVGIATSGRTPYVIAGLRYARHMGALSVGITCNMASELESIVDLVIAPVVGPEILSGSTRLKAGTATKMVLNMISTATMVQLGKTYGHWMVDLRASSTKLKARSVRIVSAVTGMGFEDATHALAASGGEVKVAIASTRLCISAHEARLRLQAANGRLRTVLERD